VSRDDAMVMQDASSGEEQWCKWSVLLNWERFAEHRWPQYVGRVESVRMGSAVFCIEQMESVMYGCST
jgi:hypothetical protein